MSLTSSAFPPFELSLHFKLVTFLPPRNYTLSLFSYHTVCSLIVSLADASFAIQNCIYIAHIYLLKTQQVPLSLPPKYLGNLSISLPCYFCHITKTNLPKQSGLLCFLMVPPYQLLSLFNLFFTLILNWTIKFQSDDITSFLKVFQLCPKVF